MGWVTLTLRKKELRATHNEYELRLLSISRQRRQLARQKTAQTAELRALETEELSGPKNTYNQARNEYREEMKSIFEDAQNTQATEGQNQQSGTNNGINQERLSAAQLEYQKAKEDFEEQKAVIKEVYEDQMAELEEETTEKETELDMDQTSLEAEIEAISQELQAVSQAISSDIQESTIKLA